MLKQIISITAIIALYSCQDKYNCSATYKGLLPAADGPGTEYILNLNTCKNLFSLKTTYLEAGNNGEEQTYTTNGKIKQKENVIELIPDNNEPPIHFIIVNDSTLRMVDDELQEASSGLNYDIIKIKK